jgi:predicted transcriptional regulator
MPQTPPHASLSKRERQIMDALYRAGRATANEVVAALPGSPHLSTVRTQLRILEEKGVISHEVDGPRYVYAPKVPRHAARRSALRHLVDTFFEGSSVKVMTALLSNDSAGLADEDLDRIAELVRSARKADRSKP